MFSHIFILHNKIFSEADSTRIPRHPIRWKQLCFLAPAKTMVQLHTPQQSGRHYRPRSHKQVLLTLGLWTQRRSIRKPHSQLRALHLRYLRMHFHRAFKIKTLCMQYQLQRRKARAVTVLTSCF